MNTRSPYPTDLTDAQWERIQPAIPPAPAGGRPRSTEVREVMNAILYLLDNGCKWRALPPDFPKWQVVYAYFRRWQAAGVWQRLNDELRGAGRVPAGRAASPSAVSSDSQSVKTTQKGGLAVTPQASK